MCLIKRCDKGSSKYRLIRINVFNDGKKFALQELICQREGAMRNYGTTTPCACHIIRPLYGACSTIDEVAQIRNRE